MIRGEYMYNPHPSKISYYFGGRITRTDATNDQKKIPEQCFFYVLVNHQQIEMKCGENTNNEKKNCERK